MLREWSHISILEQHSAGDLLQHGFSRSGFDLEQAQILLRSKAQKRCLRIRRGGNRFDKELSNLLGSGFVDLAVDAYHSAKRRYRIRLQRAFVSTNNVLPGSCATRVSVLDDRAHWLVKLAAEFPRRIKVDEIVVGQF